MELVNKTKAAQLKSKNKRADSEVSEKLRLQAELDRARVELDYAREESDYIEKKVFEKLNLVDDLEVKMHIKELDIFDEELDFALDESDEKAIDWLMRTNAESIQMLKSENAESIEMLMRTHAESMEMLKSENAFLRKHIAGNPVTSPGWLVASFLLGSAIFGILFAALTKL